MTCYRFHEAVVRRLALIALLSLMFTPYAAPLICCRCLYVAVYYGAMLTLPLPPPPRAMPAAATAAYVRACGVRCAIHAFMTAMPCRDV